MVTALICVLIIKVYSLVHQTYGYETKETSYFLKTGYFNIFLIKLELNADQNIHSIYFFTSSDTEYCGGTNIRGRNIQWLAKYREADETMDKVVVDGKCSKQ